MDVENVFICFPDLWDYHKPLSSAESYESMIDTNNKFAHFITYPFFWGENRIYACQQEQCSGV